MREIAEILLRVAIGDRDRALTLLGDLEEDAYEARGRAASGFWVLSKATSIAARFLLDRAMRPVTDRSPTHR